MPFMLHALDFSLEEPNGVVIAGDPADAGTRELLRAAHSVYQPNKVVLGNPAPSGNSRGLCPPKAARWFIFAPALRVSRQQTSRRNCAGCCVDHGMDCG
jgi:hypothetical protein